MLVDVEHHLSSLIVLVVGPARPLPVAWDGVPVEWTPWENPPRVRVCPPQEPTPCGLCGSRERPVQSRGLTQVEVGATLLIATRCPSCRLDTVWDARNDETWTLDDTDYGPEGSTAP